MVVRGQLGVCRFCESGVKWCMRGQLGVYRFCESGVKWW